MRPQRFIPQLIIVTILTVASLTTSIASAYYSPRNGRFLSRDKIGYEDGPNTYAYVRGKPTNSVDPDGRYCRVLRFERFHRGQLITDLDSKFKPFVHRGKVIATPHQQLLKESWGQLMVPRLTKMNAVVPMPTRAGFFEGTSRAFEFKGTHFPAGAYKWTAALMYIHADVKTDNIADCIVSIKELQNREAFDQGEWKSKPGYPKDHALTPGPPTDFRKGKMGNWIIAERKQPTKAGCTLTIIQADITFDYSIVKAIGRRPAEPTYRFTVEQTMTVRDKSGESPTKFLRHTFAHGTDETGQTAPFKMSSLD